MLALRRLTSVKQYTPARFASSLAAKFDASVEELPLREAVRYLNKDMRWSAQDFLRYANMHANALLDFNIKKPDTIVLWLPEGAEKHVTMMSAVKAGLKIVDVDINITEVEDVRAFLKASDCKVIFFKPEHGDHDYLLQLRKAIPEFFEYDDSHGQMFRSKYFPKLRYFFQTGALNEVGCVQYKALFLPNYSDNMLGESAEGITDKDLIYQQIKKGSNGGIEVCDALPASKVLDLPTWSFAKKIMNKEYFEV